jgi:two-component system sensor histidine kinase/response regulator
LTQEFGTAGYLVKPVSHSTLLKAVSDAMESVKGEGCVQYCDSHEGPGRPARILVAEDNVLNQAVALSILVKEGYDVTVVSNGLQAVEAYDKDPFDMILMDVQMPDMSGLEATRMIRASEAGSGRHITILALTAHAMAGDRESCMEAGMDDYLSKPLHLPALRKMIRRWLSHREKLVQPDEKPALDATAKV